jgi:ribonuclease P protein component
MSGSKSNTLGKSERLKSRKQIDLLFETGKKISQFPFRVLYKTEKGNPEIKAGFTVSSRSFSRAVDRNRIKRLTREAYRIQKAELKNKILNRGFSLHLFFIYTNRDILSFDEIKSGLKQLLNKLIQALHERHPENI